MLVFGAVSSNLLAVSHATGKGLQQMGSIAYTNGARNGLSTMYSEWPQPIAQL
jgi:hypothetical protein